LPLQKNEQSESTMCLTVDRVDKDDRKCVLRVSFYTWGEGGKKVVKTNEINNSQRKKINNNNNKKRRKRNGFSKNVLREKNSGEK